MVSVDIMPDLVAGLIGMVSPEFRWRARSKVYSFKANIGYSRILLVSYLAVIHEPLDMYNYPMYNVPN